MPVTTLIFLSLFAGSVLGALVLPVLGLFGYMLDYSVGPQAQWYEAPISHWGIRYSLTLALATLIGTVIHWRKMEIPGRIVTRHEKLLLAMLAAIWLSVALGPETVGRYTTERVDHPSIKYTKLVVLLLVMTHLVFDVKRLRWMLWTLVVSGILLGHRAYTLPRRAFVSGRLEGVGGSDFAEANFFGAYMAVVLVIAGVMFMRSKWPGKVVAFLSGGFVANAIVLTRSRGTFVGMGAGAIAAVIMAPKKMRLKLSVLLILGGIGFLWLSDPQFMDRMSTIFVDEGEERDESAQSRIVLFQASLRMIRDKPWGLGVGNFYQTIGKYVPQYKGKDAHNTYVRCYTELGLQGFAVFVAVLFSAFWGLRKTRKLAREKLGDEGKELEIMGFGLTVGLAVLLGCFLTVSLTYVEFVWWFLMMPVCLRRAVENRIAETEPEAAAEREGNPLIHATVRA